MEEEHEVVESEDEGEKFLDPNSVQSEIQLGQDDTGMEIEDEEGVEEGKNPSTTEENQTPSEDTVDDSIQFFMHNDSVYSVAMHPSISDIVVSGGGDDKAVIWNAKSGKAMFELVGHTDSITNVDFNFDGKLIATAAYDGKVNIWETWTGKLLKTLEGPNDGIEWIEWHQKGNVLLGGSRDTTCWLWNATNGTCLNVFAGHHGPLTCGGFSSDGKLVLTGGEDGTMRVFDPKSGNPLQVFQGHSFHTDLLTSLKTHASNPSLVLTSSGDGTAKLVNISTNKILATYQGHQDSVETVAFSYSLPLVATGSLDKKVHIYDLNTSQLRGACVHEDGVNKLIWHSQQPLLFTSSLDKKIRLWDSRTGKCEKLWRGHKAPILDFTLSKDGSTILTGSDDHSCLIFKVTQ